jgi:epoxyqueuosine reductase
MITSQKIKEYAKELGADLVGIGSMDRFEGAPLQYDPRQIMPKAKSIIGLGFRIHRGLLRGVEEGTYWGGYSSMGYANINDDFAPIVMRKLSNRLEDDGFETCPYHNGSVRYGIGEGKAVAPGKAKPDVFIHFRIAGVICGMGEIGHSNLFLSPEFGPAQRLVFILTEAELEPDPIFTDKLCDNCMACVRECPAHAISREKTNHVTIGTRELGWAYLDEYKCSVVFQTGTRKTSPFISEEVAGKVDEIIAAPNDHVSGMMNYKDVAGIWGWLREKVPYIRAGQESFHHPGAICGARGCMRACLDHLDKKDVLTKKFKHPYRTGKQWELTDEISKPGKKA